MHPFVGAILLRPAWMNPLMLDPEPHPPDVQVREPVNRLRRERYAVVGADRTWQAVLPERALEDGARRHGFRREEPMTGQQKPRMLIRDRERVAVHPVARAELPFEVRGPQVIRFARGDRDHARVLMRPAAGALVHQPAAREEIGDRARRRPLFHRGMSRREDLEQLPRAPEGMLTAQLAELLGAGLGNPVRAVMRGPTPICQSTAALLRIALEPLVPNTSADPVPRAQLGHREAIAQRVLNEL